MLKHFTYLLALATAGIILAGCPEKTKQPTPPNPPAGSALLVANQGTAGSAGNMTVVDIENNNLRMGAAGLGNTPNHIVRSGDKLFVINSSSHDMNVLSIDNDNALTSVDTIDLGRSNGLGPYAATIADNGRMFITNFNAGTVTLLDTATGARLSYIPVGLGPEGIMAIGDKIYVCNTNFDTQTLSLLGPGSVMIISTVSNLVIDTISVGWNPQSMALDANNLLHVVCTGNGTTVMGEVYKVFTRADTIYQVVSIGGSPGDIAITSNGFGYLAAGGWGTDPGKVYCYNAGTGQIIAGPANPIQVASGASRIVAASDNSVYVSCFDGGKVDHLVHQTRQESYSVGSGPGPLILIER